MRTIALVSLAALAGIAVAGPTAAGRSDSSEEALA
jgi:hypothetical protein